MIPKRPGKLWAQAKLPGLQSKELHRVEAVAALLLYGLQKAGAGVQKDAGSHAQTGW